KSRIEGGAREHFAHKRGRDFAQGSDGYSRANTALNESQFAGPWFYDGGTCCNQRIVRITDLTQQSLPVTCRRRWSPVFVERERKIAVVIGPKAPALFEQLTLIRSIEEVQMVLGTN